jgi:cell division protease FtsH
VTTGASNDLQRATKIARAMVTQYGMSKTLGQRTFGKKQELIFLGREISEQRDYSEEVASQIDGEIKDLMDRAESRSRNVLETYRDKLDEIANALIERETLDADELEAIIEAEEEFAETQPVVQV